MIRHALILMTLLSCFGFAEWKRTDVGITYTNVTDPFELESDLASFEHFVFQMTRAQLVSPNHIQIIKFSGDIAYYRWENDENCAVAEPQKVPEEIAWSAQADLKTVNEPGIRTVQSSNILFPPCNEPPPEEKLKRKLQK